MGTGSRGVRNPEEVGERGGLAQEYRAKFRKPGGRTGYIEARECRGWKTR